MPGRMGITTKERKAVLRNQASNLLWYERIEVTKGHVKSLRSYTEKILTLAINSYTDTVETTVTTKDSKGKEVTKKVIKDGPKKLAARRRLLALLQDRQEQRVKGEKKAAFKARKGDIKHPLIEKLFEDFAPKYAKRAEETGNGGGYTRVIKTSVRRGDNAQMALVELI